MFCFFFNDTATTEIYTLSLHDALPIWAVAVAAAAAGLTMPPVSFERSTEETGGRGGADDATGLLPAPLDLAEGRDRKSTRLHFRHLSSSDAVFRLEKKKGITKTRYVYL